MPTHVTRRSLLALLGLTGATAATGCGNASGRTATVGAPPRSAAPVLPPSQVTMRTISYGNNPSQFAELHLPATMAPSAGKLPVAVVVHGGYWGAACGLSLGSPLAHDLAEHGVAAWNIEYRRIGNGGGWPATLVDVADAMDALTTKAMDSAGGRLDLDRVVIVGHSAGGQLAGWLAGRHKLAAGTVGASPKVTPLAYVSQAGVLDLVHGYDQGPGGGAVGALMGGSPQQYPDRYATGSPYALLPLGIPGTLIHGLADTTVPIDQSDRFAAKAKQSGDQVVEFRLPGVDHFMLIDPTTPAWAQCRKAALGYLTLS